VTPEVPLVVAGEPEDRDLFVDFLRGQGVMGDRVQTIDAPLDSMWVRDYGPVFVRGVGGMMWVVDLPYHANRGLDDELPQRVGAQERLLTLSEKLPLEGGHIASDGQGLCIVSEDVVVEALEPTTDEAFVRARLDAVFGCRHTVFVPPLFAEETGHVDVFAMITGPARVVVGEYSRREDRVNARRLDEAASRLTDAGFEVTRIPMPSNDHWGTFRTYTNALILDRSVLVPTYRRHRLHEERALEILADAFPGRRIVPIEASPLAELGGAIHCATRTIPRGGGA
jgi:agmatine deiminase